VNEYGFAVLGLGAVCVGLLGVLMCVLAEMRHRGKAMDVEKAESVLPPQHLWEITPLRAAVRIWRLNIRQLPAGARARPGATLGGWRLQWGGPCRTYSLTWRIADRANW
jgi:hypothetical protein